MLKTWYTYLVPGALISGIVFFTLVSSLELNPVTIPYESSRLIFTVVPQGWGFFFKGPQGAADTDLPKSLRQLHALQ